MHSARFRSISLRLLKFLQIKEGDLISWKNQFCRKSDLFGPLFCISNLKGLRIQRLGHALDFKTFCMIQVYFYKSPQIYTN